MGCLVQARVTDVYVAIAAVNVYVIMPGSVGPQSFLCINSSGILYEANGE